MDTNQTQGTTMEQPAHNLYYTGIGSRKTPQEHLVTMTRLAMSLGKRGYTLRSGAAQGADTAFESGADAGPYPKEIWLPWPNFNGHRGLSFLPTEENFNLAKTVHPAWDRLLPSVQKLHARNTGQVLGVGLNQPSVFVICYTPDGAELQNQVKVTTGGTGTAIRLASVNAIPVFNLYHSDCVERIRFFLQTLSSRN